MAVQALIGQNTTVEVLGCRWSFRVQVGGMEVGGANMG